MSKQTNLVQTAQTLTLWPSEIKMFPFYRPLSTAFPFIRLGKTNHLFTQVQVPDLYDALVDIPITVELDNETLVDSFVGTVAGSIVTLDSTEASLLAVAAIEEDKEFYGSYTRLLTIAGVNYPVTALNTTTRAFTVTGTPPTDTQTVQFFSYRTATGIQIRKADGIVLATGGASGRVTGLVTRDRMQLIEGSITNSGPRISFVGSGAISNGGAASDAYGNGANTGHIVNFSSQYAGQRTGSTTRDRSLGVNMYMYAGSIINV